MKLSQIKSDVKIIHKQLLKYLRSNNIPYTTHRNYIDDTTSLSGNALTVVWLTVQGDVYTRSQINDQINQIIHQHNIALTQHQVSDTHYRWTPHSDDQQYLVSTYTDADQQLQISLRYTHQ